MGNGKREERNGGGDRRQALGPGGLIARLRVQSVVCIR